MAIVNDNFANSIRLDGFSVSTTGTNVGSTGEAGEPYHGSTPDTSVWWNWTAPTNGVVTIDTFGSNFDTALGIHIGSVVNNLSTVTYNDDYWGLQSQVSFQAVAGQTYNIAVDGWGASQGLINLNLNLALNYTQAGTVGNDFLFGTNANDVIGGLAGDDSIFGNGGKDTLIGGDGDDLIYGGSDADYILGGHGNDTIYANGGGDLINSGSGLDTVWLGGGAATVVLEAGEGFDTVKNFQAGQTLFQLGSNLSYADLTFADSADGAVISANNDVLAVVSWQSASAINSAANFV